MNTISVIKRSVGCQWLGVWSLVPVVGIVFAMAALHRYRHVRAEVGDEWNPAQPQLKRGVLFAWAGVLITVGLVGFVALRLLFAAIARGEF